MAKRRYFTDLGTLTATGAGDFKGFPNERCVIQATSSNNGGTFTSATVDIEARISSDHAWEVIATLSLSGDGDSDSFPAESTWAYVRANVTAFSGTGSTPQVIVGIQT